MCADKRQNDQLLPLLFPAILGVCQEEAAVWGHAAPTGQKAASQGRQPLAELCCANNGGEGAGIQQHGPGPWKQMCRREWVVSARMCVYVCA